jgi:predicted RNA-binding Zn-ribbon protein involved in translation (DUF1610 family)
MGTIEYYQDIIECTSCGAENACLCISTTESGETFNEIVVGQKCTSCGADLTSF